MPYVYQPDEKTTSDDVQKELGYEVIAKAMKITPEIAAEWLKSNTNNYRKPDLHKVDQYRRAMLQGEFKLNGMTITFNELGNLSNGQHRLMACVKAGVPFWCVVVWGIREEEETDIDMGMNRTDAQELTRRGEKNTTILAAMIRRQWQYDHGCLFGSVKRASVSEMLGILQENPGMRESATWGRRIARLVPHGAMGAFLHYRFSLIDKELSDDYFQGLIDPSLLKQDDPVFALRRAILSLQQGGGSWPEKKTYGLMVKAWNKRRKDEPAKVLQFRLTGINAEELPEIK